MLNHTLFVWYHYVAHFRNTEVSVFQREVSCWTNNNTDEWFMCDLQSVCVCVLAAEDMTMVSGREKCENGLWALCRSMQSFPRRPKVNTFTFWTGSDSTHALSLPFFLSQSGPAHVTPFDSPAPTKQKHKFSALWFKFMLHLKCVDYQQFVIFFDSFILFSVLWIMWILRFRSTLTQFLKFWLDFWVFWCGSGRKNKVIIAHHIEDTCKTTWRTNRMC